MTCGKSLSLFLLLLCLSVLAHGQSTEPESSPPSETPPDTTISTLPSPELPSNFVELWNQFAEKYQDFNLSLEQFLDQVEQFGISFEDLPLYLEFLTNSYAESEKIREEKTEIIRRQETELWIWRGGTVLACLAFLASLFL